MQRLFWLLLQVPERVYYQPPYIDPYANGYYAYGESEEGGDGYYDDRWRWEGSRTATPSSLREDPQARWEHHHTVPPPRTEAERAQDRFGLGWMRGLT